MSFTRSEKIKMWFREHVRIPLGVTIAVCVLPVILTGLFYALRSSTEVMDFAVRYISAPVRGFLGLLSSIYPFSLMEIIGTVAGIFLIYYIIKAFRDSLRRREKWKILGKRLLPVLVVACYLWGLFCWLWNSGYHATGFAARYNFSSDGIARDDLIVVTQMFADRASELSAQVERDADGSILSHRRDVFAESMYIYRNISEEFPSLNGRLYAPKPMLYSWLMSITGYGGMYFALTGEAMINTQVPISGMPALVAHEHSHRLGVFAEDEASFVGILACVKSENTFFEYSGYLEGLNYLLHAIMRSDNFLSSGISDEWLDIMSGLSANVRRDRHERAEFWSTRTTSNIGIDFLDRFFTNVAETANDAVNAVYDGFLRSQNQELGIRSYGACVDLLVEYFIADALVYWDDEVEE